MFKETKNILNILKDVLEKDFVIICDELHIIISSEEQRIIVKKISKINPTVSLTLLDIKIKKIERFYRICSELRISITNFIIPKYPLINVIYNEHEYLIYYDVSEIVRYQQQYLLTLDEIIRSLDKLIRLKHNNLEELVESIKNLITNIKEDSSHQYVIIHYSKNTREFFIELQDTSKFEIIEHHILHSTIFQRRYKLYSKEECALKLLQIFVKLKELLSLRDNLNVVLDLKQMKIFIFSNDFIY